MNEKYGKRSGKYDLRNCKTRTYDHLHVMHNDVAMSQVNVKEGIKRFGEAGVSAVVKELKQLHDWKVMEPVPHNSLTNEQKSEALNYLMFLKQKRDGTIKGRGCADGRKQRNKITKMEASSLTVAMESALLSCTIDEMESRDVGIVDVPGAFMHAKNEDLTHVKLAGKMAKLLVQIETKLYRKYVWYDHGKRAVLYVEFEKGTIWHP
jgi:hypothetical protein